MRVRVRVCVCVCVCVCADVGLLVLACGVRWALMCMKPGNTYHGVACTCTLAMRVVTPMARLRHNSNMKVLNPTQLFLRMHASRHASRLWHSLNMFDLAARCIFHLALLV